MRGSIPTHGMVIGMVISGMCVRVLKEKGLELSTPNLVDMQCMAVAHRLT